MRDSTYMMIKDAINRKKQIVATYDGHRREMCPHVIGRNKDGEECVFVFQFGGDSESANHISLERKPWRCLKIAKLSDIIIRDGEWHTASDASCDKQTCVHIKDVSVNGF